MTHNARIPRIMVTGCNGFVGKHLISYFIKNKCCVGGLDRDEKGLPSLAVYYPVDILDKKSILEVFRDFCPTHVIHLAAVTFVPDSLKNIDNTIQINVQGTVNLLQSIDKIDNKETFSRFLYISSADVYNTVASGGPFTEDDHPHPENPYAISKLSGEYLCEFFQQRHHIPSFIVRPFNHTGPGQSEKFVCSDFARQVALIEKEKQEPVIRVGNLNHARDFLDVRDVVRAYHALLFHESNKTSSVFNVSSGKCFRIKWLLDTLLAHASVDIEVVIDKKKYRPGESIMQGTYDKLFHGTGWQPSFSMEKTLFDLLQWWRERIS